MVEMTEAQSQSADGGRPGPSLSRRDVLQTTAATGVAVAAGGSFEIHTVSATDSGDVELSIDADIPEESAIKVSVMEYPDSFQSFSDNDDSTIFEEGESGQSRTLSGLDGADYYEFEIALGTDNEITEDGEGSPTLESLTLDIPEEADDDGDGDDDAVEFETVHRLFGIDVPSWVPGTSEETVEAEGDDDGGGFWDFLPWVESDSEGLFSFDFDFWPFGEGD